MEPSRGSAPRFSIITAARDAEPFLKRATDSVLAQYFEDFELIIVENGSSDGTAALAHEIEGADPRVRTIIDGPTGIGPARNAGIAEATGEWLAFLDADDSWDPAFLATIDRAIRTRPGSALYACNGLMRYRRFSSATTSGFRHMLPHKLDAARMAWMSVLPGQVVVSANIARDLRGFEDRRGEETDLWLRILLRESGYWIPHRLYHNYKSPTGVSRQPGARAGVGRSLGDSLESHLDEAADPRTRKRLARRADRWFAFAKAAETRDDLETRMARGEYRGSRADYIRSRDAYVSRWRFVVGLPIMMLAPPLFARLTGAGHAIEAQAQEHGPTARSLRS